MENSISVKEIGAIKDEFYLTENNGYTLSFKVTDFEGKEVNLDDLGLKCTSVLYLDAGEINSQDVPSQNGKLQLNIKANTLKDQNETELRLFFYDKEDNKPSLIKNFKIKPNYTNNSVIIWDYAIEMNKVDNFTEDFYNTIKGAKGDDGKDGKSAYEIAVENGFKGSEAEWVASLKGKDGLTVVPDGSVTTLKLADKSITNAKLADNHDYVKTLENGTNTYSVVRTGNYMLNANGNYLNMPSDSLPNRIYQLRVESISDVWLMQTLVDFTEPKNQWKRRIHKTSTTVKEQWNANFNIRNGSIGSPQLMDAFSFRNNLGTGTDISTIFKEGMYLGISTNNYTNIPSELIGKNFVLQVIPARADGAFKQQIITPFEDLTTTYKRFTLTKDGNAEWQKYRTSSNDTSHPLAGRVIVTFGDSITENGNYPELLASITKMDVVKAGFGGCRMGQHAVESATGQLYDKQCMHSLVDYIKSGDFTELIQTTETMVRSNGDDNRSQATALSKTDWSKVNYISIFFGTNDYGGNVPIGENGDSTGATFKGAINKVIKTLSESQPHIKLVFVTPFYRDRFQATGDGKNSDDFANEVGATLQDYVDAIELLAKKNHIPVINLMNDSGINKYNQSHYLADGLHPNATGYKYLADILARQMTAKL